MSLVLVAIGIVLVLTALTLHFTFVECLDALEDNESIWGDSEWDKRA